MNSKSIFSQEYISKKEILEYDAKLNNLEKYQTNKFQEMDLFFENVQTEMQHQIDGVVNKMTNRFCGAFLDEGG